MTISPINLGNSFSSGGSSALGGISSGLNTQSVINSLVASQSAQVTSLNDQVTVNNKQIGALSTLQQLLTQLQTASTQLSKPQSPNSNSNVFATTSATVTSNTSQAPANFLTASANAAAPSGTYTISNISQLATPTTQQTGSFTVSPSTTPLVVASGAVTGQFNAGTFTINGPNGNASVTFTAGDNLNQIASDFNAVNATTGLTATVKTVSPGVFTLAFSNTVTGAPVNFDLTKTANIMSDPSHVFAAQKSATFTLSADVNPVVVASGATAGQFNAGTISITGPGGTGNVTINAGDNLSAVAGDFNAASSATGITASVLQTSPGVYKLVFSSSTTGAASLFDFSNTAATTVTSDPSGVLTNVTFQAMTAANEGQDAQFTLNGTAITRPTNQVGDLISGVTLNLLQNTAADPGASFTIRVAASTSTIQTAVDNFATAYNNFLTFYAQQTATNANGTPTSSAILFSDTTLRSVYNQLTAQVASVVTGLPNGSSNQLADIGLGFFNSAASSTAPAVSNLLSVDDATLDAAIGNNLSGVENVFGYNLTSSSPNLVSFQAAKSQTVPSFTMNIDQTTPSYTATYTDSFNVLHTVNFTANSLGTGGIALTADPASALSGLVLIYTGTGNQSGITVNTTQGIAAQMSTFLTGALTANTGLLATDQSGIQTHNTTLQTQISTVTAQVTAQREELLKKFSALEAAIAKANSALNLLNAQQLAASSGG